VPEAGRVITGSAGGLRLVAPGSVTRPISDRVKQALFSLLEAERIDIWRGAVLDLFAGSGALAIEALSRGAPRAVLVERDRRAVAAIIENLEHTHLSERARVLRRDVTGFLERGANEVPEAPFAAVFLDPPYAQTGDLAEGLARLGGADAGWLDARACVAAKHFWKTPPPDRVGELARSRTRRFGETAVSVYRRPDRPVAGGT
jgi:16S rRNA (guanine966-N2)-methyltransferase